METGRGERGDNANDNDNENDNANYNDNANGNYEPTSFQRRK